MEWSERPRNKSYCIVFPFICSAKAITDPCGGLHSTFIWSFWWSLGNPILVPLCDNSAFGKSIKVRQANNIGFSRLVGNIISLTDDKFTQKIPVQNRIDLKALVCYAQVLFYGLIAVILPLIFQHIFVMDAMKRRFICFPF